MFENYLDDVNVYLELEKFFSDYFNLKLKELRINKDFFKIPFYKTVFNNGMPFMDGNPIFSVKNEIKETILRIIIDEDVNELTLLNQKSEFGKEFIVIGNIGMLDDISIKIYKWLEEQ
jgi:hypothetical protein